MRDPGNGSAVIEAKVELHIEGDSAALALDDAHQIARAIAKRHEVDENGSAGLGLKLGFENERVVAVAARAADVFT